jgi:amino acid adenylation domain-containing protein
MEELIHLAGFTNLPLSSNQKRLWIVFQQDKSNPAYNLSLTYKLIGDINIAVFRKSLLALCTRQHTMFSVFKQKDGEPYIEITQRSVNVEIKDFSNFPVETRKEAILSFAGEDSRKCFDLEKGPLFRFYLLKEDEKDYVFHATIHHIIFDGWSMRLFVQEFSTIYNNFILSLNENHEPLKFHSYDYPAWEESSLSPEDTKNMIEFWKEYLKECQTELKFPYDNTRKNQPTGLGFRESFFISEILTNKLRELGKKGNASLFKIMLSILGVLFQKYSGVNDICIGFPFSMRRGLPYFERLFGLFVNTSLVRLRIEGDISFKELIIHTKDPIDSSILNSKLPFDKIVEIVNPERMSNMNPLVQVALSWWKDVTIPMETEGLKGARINVPEGVSPFDITFYMWEEGDILKGEIEYNIDILEYNTIIRLKNNFIKLVQSVTEFPDLKLSEISDISDTDLRLLESFNDTEVYVPDFLIQTYFENQVARNPLKTAITFGSENMTYRELDNRSNQLARHLITAGLAPRDIVGIYLDRSIDMVISILGILKSGCCYLPLDPSFPLDRLSYMVEDSGAKFIISQRSLKSLIAGFANSSQLILDEEREAISNYPVVKPEIRIDCDFPAYIIYTSGSTGKPKGVQVHHRSVVNLISSMSKIPGISENDRLLAVVTLSFDMSVFELFLPLSNGATLTIASNDDITDSHALIKIIEKNDITIIQATPSFWNILLSGGWKGKNNLTAICGGEALTSNLVKQILPKVRELWNCYGPTETTVYSTFYKFEDINSQILIGRPIENTKIYILNKDNMPVPIGVAGEVAIGGMGVTKGYHNRPGLTNEKFIQFENDQVIYKTGDLGRYLDNGNIELSGRIDNQIKLRGFRIEPGEIEALLVKLEGVKESEVKTHRFDDDDERLVAYLNVNNDFTLSREDIIRSLGQNLPQHMIPSFFQRYDGFPRTPNGKINKNLLKLELTAPELNTINNKIEHENEREFTSSERTIFDIWSDKLKTNNFSITDNFFDIGGNSLIAISVMAKIEAAFNIDLGLRVFFDSPRIKDLAEAIEFALKKSTSGKTSEKLKQNNLRIVKGEI